MNKLIKTLSSRFWEVDSIFEAVLSVDLNSWIEWVCMSWRFECYRKDQTINSFCFAPTECENFLEDGLSSVCASSQGVLKRESGSESDFFSLPGDGMEDLVFGKVGKSDWYTGKKKFQGLIL